jgi:membrane associated rhomboid family serine protease
MLDDRSYMRESSGRRQWSVTFALLIINTAIFVLQELTKGYTQLLIHKYFALSTTGLAHGYIWQLFTYQFLHSGFLHLIFNLIVVYFFGRAIEDVLGRRQMLTLYLSSGAIGGLLQTLLAFALPEYFGGSVVGASAAGFGLVAAFATMFPQQQLTLLVFFVIPVTLRARTLLWMSIGIAIFFMLPPVSSGSTVAHAAHLGGILAGIAFIKWIVQGEGFNWFHRRRSARAPWELVTANSAKSKLWPRGKPSDDEDLGPDEFISKEVDPILDKISEQGIHSLTEHERKVLEAARRKMGRH